jgi:acetyl esterase/lipase
MTPADLQALPSRPPTRRVSYGTDSLQFGELRIPDGPGPHPVAVLIHGGCFKATYADRRDLAPMGDTLAVEGIATWNIEYRRVGHPGGGWPGTYLDVGRAVDHLRTLANEHALDLSRVVVVGHSAGGHLAMWTAARHRLPPESPLHLADPLPIRGVVNLAGPVDLTANIEGYQSLCRDSVITGLMGGTPATVPERYAQASAIRHVPLGVTQLFVIGDHEDFVPQRFAEAYVRAASAAGDSIRLLVLPRTGHFEVAMPTTEVWAPIAAGVRSLLDGRLTR